MRPLFTLLIFAACFLFTAQAQVSGNAAPAAEYRQITADGAWCWFSDPRAVYFEGDHKRTYAGWVNTRGDVMIGYYDHETGETAEHIVYPEFEIDDHDNPALYIKPDGTMMLFYSLHSGKRPILMSVSDAPEDITSWQEPREVGIMNEEAVEELGKHYTYANVIYLSEEDALYLFWRGSDGKPTYSVSTDGGGTWSPGEIFVMPERIYTFRRPYVKVCSNGTDRIGIAFTDGHPRKELTNSIYYMYLQEGVWHQADGTPIKPLGAGPVRPDETGKAYDATLETGKGWIWDIAFDEEDNPAMAYVRFPDDSNHIYCYARWDGEAWRNHDVVNSGSWFPETPEGEIEREPNYSGGLVLDHEDPNTLYLSASRVGVFEIEEWHTGDGGATWQAGAITSGSANDNIRPFAVRGAGAGNPVQLLWLTNRHYIHYTDYDSSIRLPVVKQPR